MMKKFTATIALLLMLAMGAAAETPDELQAVGQVVGIRLQGKYVTVAGFTEDGAAKDTGLREGDRLLAVDGAPVRSAEEISALVDGPEPVAVTVGRDGETASYLVTPREQGGKWRLGLRLRDKMSGVGTLTWYDAQTGACGALGHGVYEPEKRALCEITDGELLPAEVTSVTKGEKGAAGQLRGEVRGAAIGTVEKNTPHGVFGRLRTEPACGKTVPVAKADEIRVGDAEILSTLSGSEATYGVRILRIYPTEEERNLLLEVTDDRLLDATGGIVQGMSGSPILQDGRLVGAVTHVLVGDPTKGYGIFIGKMLEAS